MTFACIWMRYVKTIRLIALIASISHTIERDIRAEADEPEQPPFHAKHVHQGKVIDKDTGKPVAGVEVSIVLRIMVDAEWTSQHAKAITNPDGTFTCVLYYDGALQQTTIELIIQHNHYMYYNEYFAKILVGGAAIDRFIDDNLSRISIRPARAIAGVIVDHDGLPAGDLEIDVYSTWYDQSERLHISDDARTHRTKTRTDSKGHFRAEAAATGPIVVASASKRYPETAWVIKNGNRGDLGTFRLDEAVIVSGRVVDKAGNPVVLARLEGFLEDLEIDPYDEIYRSVGYYSGSQDVTTTNEHGEFAFRPISLGDFTIDIKRRTDSDWELRFVDPVDVYVKKSIRLKSGMKQARVEFRPVPDVFVEVRLIDQRVKDNLYGPRGLRIYGEVQKTEWETDFALTNNRPRKIRVPHGLENAEIHMPIFFDNGVKYKLEGDRDYSYALYSINLATIDSDRKMIDIVFYDYPSISILVKTDGSREPDDLRVDFDYSKTNDRRFVELLEDLSFSPRFQATIDSGFDDVSIIPNCDLIITASAEGYEPAVQTVNLKEGERRVLEFVLKRKIKP